MRGFRPWHLSTLRWARARTGHRRQERRCRRAPAVPAARRRKFFLAPGRGAVHGVTAAHGTRACATSLGTRAAKSGSFS